MRNLLLIIMLFLGIVFAGCSTDGAQNKVSDNKSSVNIQNSTPPSKTPGNSSAPSVTATPPDEAIADTADFEGTTGITDKKNIGIKANGVMSAVRTARHGNYDRVVLEFLGAELPGYHIEYIGKPVSACGSGNVVPLASDARLEVRFTDAVAHAPEGDATITDRERVLNLPIIKEMKITCDFEGGVTWVFGVISAKKYRVLELKNPTRLVVDIKH